MEGGNQLVGVQYVLGGGHGEPNNEVHGAYDCSSSVDHILYYGGFLGVNETPDSGTLESFGEPGPGKWVTIYANSGHVFMYVAGLLWNTWNPATGEDKIGWFGAAFSAEGFTARHPFIEPKYS